MKLLSLEGATLSVVQKSVWIETKKEGTKNKLVACLNQKAAINYLLNINLSGEDFKRAVGFVLGVADLPDDGDLNQKSELITE